MYAMGDQLLNIEQTQRSLWLGDLPTWVDEAFLVNVFAPTQQLTSVKLIRNRMTGVSEGYAFLEFQNHASADYVLKMYNGQTVPGTDLTFRLNWAVYGVGKSQGTQGGEGTAGNGGPGKLDPLNN